MALVRSDARTASRQIRKTTRRPETPKRKRRPGRPPQYKPEFAKQVMNYCLLGATNKELGRVFGVDERTINRWLVTKPEFCQAVKDGRELADANVARALYLKATGQLDTACRQDRHQDRDPARRHGSSPSTSCPTSSTSRPTPPPPSSGSRTASPTAGATRRRSTRPATTPPNSASRSSSPPRPRPRRGGPTHPAPRSTSPGASPGGRANGAANGARKVGRCTH